MERNGKVSFKTFLVCFSRLLKCLNNLYGKQCGPISDCSYEQSDLGTRCLLLYLNILIMLGSYLQQMTSPDDIF